MTIVALKIVLVFIIFASLFCYLSSSFKKSATKKIIKKIFKVKEKKRDFFAGDFDIPFPESKISKWLRIHISYCIFIGGRELFKKICLLIGIASFILMFFLANQGMSIALSLFISISCFIFVFAFTLRNIKSKNTGLFKDQLPDAIDMFASSTQAGVSVNNTFKDIGNHFSKPLGPQFTYIANQLTIGNTLQDTLKDSAKRIGILDYRFFATVLMVNQSTGSEISPVLKKLSQSLRDRKGIELKLKSATSESRAAAKILSAFPFVAMGAMYFSNPSAIDFLLQDPTGNKIMIYAIGSIFFGIWIIAKITKIST